jgi:hypothetical protein
LRTAGSVYRIYWEASLSLGPRMQQYEEKQDAPPQFGRLKP